MAYIVAGGGGGEVVNDAEVFLLDTKTACNDIPDPLSGRAFSFGARLGQDKPFDCGGSIGGWTNVSIDCHTVGSSETNANLIIPRTMAGAVIWDASTIWITGTEGVE
jgi:hypothetical protein